MKETWMSNLSLKLLSVLAAILIWLVVVNVDDPVRTETYAGIRVVLVNSEAITSKGKVFSVEDNSDIISLQVSAKRSVHKKLSNADFVATADMEKDIQYDNLVAINVTCTNKNVKSTDIKQSRNNVKVNIENSATEEFNVTVKQKGVAGEGHIVGEMIPERRVIAVTGPESLIEKIRRLEVEADVSGSVAGDSVVAKIKVVDGNGEAVDTSHLSFYGKNEGLSVKYTMLKTKEVDLLLNVSGTPGIGYRYVGLSYKPETVLLAGSEKDLKELNVLSIPGEAVDITGIRNNQEFEVALAAYLPENIRLVDAEADGLVIVAVNVEAEQTREFEVPVSNISLSGVPKGYSVTFGETESILIPVTALSAELDTLDVEHIAVKLDVSSVDGENTYVLPLEIHIPGAYKVSGRVEITFELLKGNSGQGNSEPNEGPDDESAGDKPKDPSENEDQESSDGKNEEKEDSTDKQPSEGSDSSDNDVQDNAGTSR